MWNLSVHWIKIEIIFVVPVEHSATLDHFVHSLCLSDTPYWHHMHYLIFLLNNKQVYNF